MASAGLISDGGLSNAPRDRTGDGWQGDVGIGEETEGGRAGQYMTPFTVERIREVITTMASGSPSDDDCVDAGCALIHLLVLAGSLADARDELRRYIDFMHKHDYREYAEPVEAKVAAIDALIHWVPAGRCPICKWPDRAHALGCPEGGGK